jgi:predicted nucleotidyltransferase
MNLKKEQIRIEQIAKKTTISVLRVLAERPYASFSISELSRASGVSKSNVLAALGALIRVGAARQARGGRRKLFRADAGRGMALALAELFMQEKIANLRPEVRNAVEYFLSKAPRAEAVVLFGSHAYGLGTAKSDIDIMVVGEAPKGTDLLPYRFEIHRKSWEEIEKLADFVALEAVMNGIVFRGTGRLFGIKAGLQGFPKGYALFRLGKAKEYAEKAKVAGGEAKKYYKELLRITLGELESLLYEGKVVPKKMIKAERGIRELEERLGMEGERIWLTGT